MAYSEMFERINMGMKSWQQGDCAMQECWFIHVGNPAEPLSEAAAGSRDEGPQALISETYGSAVVSQTCDIVRDCEVRPYIEVCPIVKIDGPDKLREIQKGRRPAYATLPVLLSKGYAIDLDRTMTVEKAIVAGWNRTCGCSSDADKRAFAEALSRKRVGAFQAQRLLVVLNLPCAPS